MCFKDDLIHVSLPKSAGTEGFDLVPPSTGCSMHGRYEIGLLCLGMMHFRFGHPNLALEVSINSLIASMAKELFLTLKTCLEPNCTLNNLLFTGLLVTLITSDAHL